MEVQTVSRKSTDAMLVQDVADNPYFGPTSPTEHRIIPVMRTLRNDPVGMMYAKGQINEAQKEAARRWQLDNELAGPRIKSPGSIEEPVDGGGGLPRSIVDSQIDAYKRLQRYAGLLGPRQHQLLVLVCRNGISPWGATAALFPGELTNKRREFTGLWFKEILSMLAREMRLAS